MAEQVLSIMEIILDESNAEPLSEDKVSEPSLCCADTGNLHCLIASSRLVCVSLCHPRVTEPAQLWEWQGSTN